MSNADSPMLSIVVPVYNDPEGIRTTLESLTAQTYSVADYEVLVVDNNSTDDTRKVIREYCERYPDLVSLLIEDDVQSSYAARNKGIEYARGALVSFVDADMTVEPTWAKSVVASHAEHGWDYMGCAITVYADSEESLAMLYDWYFLGFPIQQYLETKHFVVTACLTVRQELFDTVGRFDTRVISGGDMEFGQRVHNAGFEQYFESDITMYHPARATLPELLSKSVRIGRGTAQLAHHYPDRFELQSFFDPQRYLPPYPVWIWEKITDRSSPTLGEFFAIYVVAYLYKLSKSFGELSEYINTEYSTSRVEHY